jgi:hypothetical protein
MGVRGRGRAPVECPCALGGFGIFEASDLQEAIRLVARTPCAVAQGVVEVWPFDIG